MILPQFTEWALSRPIAWTAYEFGASATFTDTPIPQFGTHLLYELQVRGDNALSTTNLQVGVNSDSTAAEYHFQRGETGEDNAASQPEGTSIGSGQVAGGLAVAGYYSPVWVIFPWYSSAARQKTWYLQYAREAAALNQLAGWASAKRQGVLGAGALTDPITSTFIAISAAGQNILGTMRRGIIP